MSNIYDQKIADYIEKHDLDLLCEWLEVKKNEERFMTWLWGVAQTEARERVFKAFLQSDEPQPRMFFEEIQDDVKRRMEVGEEPGDDDYDKERYT